MEAIVFILIAVLVISLIEESFIFAFICGIALFLIYLNQEPEIVKENIQQEENYKDLNIKNYGNLEVVIKEDETNIIVSKKCLNNYPYLGIDRILS